MSKKSTTQINIKVIVGSTREGRFSIKAAEWISSQIKTQTKADVEILDLATYKLPFFDQSVSPSYKQGDYPHQNVVEFSKKIGEADAYVIVTPEYNRGPSAVLKNALDWVYKEWNNKPVGFVSYGTVGGARAVEQLRLNAIELQMAPIREAVQFLGNDFFAVTLGGADINELFAKYQETSEKMINQLIWWANALKDARSK